MIIQVLGKAIAGDTFGEIGVLCYRPQPFTVRTTELSQILRLSRTSLMNGLQANTGDSDIIMNNLFKVYAKNTRQPLEYFNFWCYPSLPTTDGPHRTLQKIKGQESLDSEYPQTDLGLILRERPTGGDIEGCCSFKGVHDNSHENQSKQKDSNAYFQNFTEKNEIRKAHTPTRSTIDVNWMEGDDQMALHAAVSKGHLEMVKMLLERGASVNKPDARGRTPKALAERHEDKSIYDLLLSYENRNLDEHRIEFIGPEAGEGPGSYKRKKKSQIFHSHLNKLPTNSNSKDSSPLSDNKGIKPNRLRVTIHMQFQDTSESHRQLGKLIILPDSIEELLEIAGKLS